MIEEDARKLVYSLKAPLEAAALLLDEEIVLLREAAGRWMRISVDHRNFDEDWNLLSIPNPVPEPCSEQFEMLLAAGDLIFENADEITASGGKRNLSHYAHVDASDFAAAIRAADATVVRLSEDANWRWHKAKQKATYEIEAIANDCRALELVTAMARDRSCAFPRDSGAGSESYWYEYRPIRTSPFGEVIVSRPRRQGEAKAIDYDIPHHASRMGLVGEILIGEDEVFVLTQQGFEAAGFTPGERDVVAPEDWRAAYEERYRTTWAPVAEQQGIIVLEREETVLYEDEEGAAEEPLLGWAKGDVVVEEAGGSTIAVQRPGLPFEWLKRYGTAADPFTAREYSTVDDLLRDLLAAGRHVTDLRKCVGNIGRVEQAVEMLEAGMVIEHADGRMYLRHPRENGIHGDLFELDWKVHQDLTDRGVIVEALGYRTDYEHEFIEALPHHPLVTALKQLDASKARSRKPDTSAVVGFDDDGIPITEDQVVFESYQKPVGSSTFGLLAPFDYPGGDDQYEIDQQVENVRQRRRLASGSRT